MNTTTQTAQAQTATSPGPWQTGPEWPETQQVRDSTCRAILFPSSWIESGEEKEANARLAAAAPALLAALETVCNIAECALDRDMGDGWDDEEDQASYDKAMADVESARALLARAKVAS